MFITIRLFYALLWVDEKIWRNGALSNIPVASPLWHTSMSDARVFLHAHIVLVILCGDLFGMYYIYTCASPVIKFACKCMTYKISSLIIDYGSIMYTIFISLNTKQSQCPGDY